jgi:hypothetical protein
MFGKSNINIFVAATLYQKSYLQQAFAVPLVWEVFSKKGNTNTSERKHLMNRLFDVVGKKNIKEILADREFIGNEWLNFLHDNEVPFVVRIKKTANVEYNGKLIAVLELVGTVKRDEKRYFEVKLHGIPVKLAATRSIDGQLVIVVASQNIVGDPLGEYRLRYLIELFFKSAKSKGFNLEDTHMTDPMRIKVLFAFIALATICAVRVGVIRHRFKKIPVKNHGRPEFSLFTYGLDCIKALFRGDNMERILGISGSLKKVEFRSSLSRVFLIEPSWDVP